MTNHHRRHKITYINKLNFSKKQLKRDEKIFQVVINKNLNEGALTIDVDSWIF